MSCMLRLHCFIGFQSTVLNRNEKETVEKLIRRAKDEVVLENEWNRPGKSKDMHDVDPEKFLKIYKSHSSFPDGTHF